MNNIALVTLCGKRVKQSQSSREADDSESNFNPCKVNLTHTLGTPIGHSEATVCLSFRFVEQSHHKRLLDHTHIQCAGHTSVARLHDRIPVCFAECTPTVGACKHKNKSRVVGDESTCRADWLLGLPLTIFRGMWLVLSNA
jgi:hypothetical protein